MIGDGLSRVCRLDMALGANQLQAAQQTARVQDLVQANKLLSLALALGGLKGIKYVASPFRREEAMFLTVNDASHAASFKEVKPILDGGHRY